MDPILEEMKRSREMRPDRFRTCVDYLCALVAAKDDEIASLKAQLAANRNNELTEGAKHLAVSDAVNGVKRGPGRPRKDAEAAHV